MKRLIAFFAVLGTVIIVGIPSTHTAQASSQANVTVCGNVYLSGSGVAGATIFLLDQNTGAQGNTVTGFQGSWCVQAVPGHRLAAQAKVTIGCWWYLSDAWAQVVDSHGGVYHTLTLARQGRVC